MASIGDLIGQNSIDKLYESLTQEVDNAKIKNDYTKGLRKELAKTFGNTAVSSSGNSISVTYKILDSNSNDRIRFFDLKPYFARSAFAKRTKGRGSNTDTGWYLKVPVGGYQKSTTMRMAYGRNVWDKISHIDFGSTYGGNDNVARFQRILANTDGQGQALAYKWKSNSITRVPYGSSGSRGRYITFRTVSNKSDPMSWIVGRDSLTSAINNNSISEDEAREIATIVKGSISRSIDKFNKEKELSNQYSN